MLWKCKYGSPDLSHALQNILFGAVNTELVEQKLGAKIRWIPLTSKIKEYASVIPRGNRLSKADKSA